MHSPLCEIQNQPPCLYNVRIEHDAETEMGYYVSQYRHEITLFMKTLLNNNIARNVFTNQKQ